MKADDPRHGTPNGYNHGGCRDNCCRDARNAYERQYRKISYCYGPVLISNLGTVRRLQALAALGWTLSDIGRRMGRSQAMVAKWRKGDTPTIRRDTAAAVDRVYRDLCMTIPNTWVNARTRRRAQRLGWFPPLAWDDIDDPNEYPGLGVLWGEDAA